MNVVVDEAEEVNMKSLNRHKLGRILLKVFLEFKEHFTDLILRATT